MSGNLQVDLSAIEAAAVLGWPALETASVDGWLWRYSAGGSTRANSVATVTFTGRDVERAITAVEGLAKSRNAAACFIVSAVSEPADLDARLAARGYAIESRQVTMAKQVDAAATTPDDVAIGTSATEDWLTVYLAGLSADRRPAAPAILAKLPDTARYISALADGRTVASGLTVPDGKLASVQCMATAVHARRQGHSQRVLRAIEYLAAKSLVAKSLAARSSAAEGSAAERMAASDGERILYLQASASNAGALALYERMGFAIVGHYHTRSKSC